MKKLVVIFSASLLACAYVLGGGRTEVTTQAQEDPSAAGRIERKLKEKEPRFKFQTRGTGGKAIKHQWRSGKEFVTVSINEMESAEAARELLQMVVSSVSMGIITRELNLGDEAYLIKSSPQIIQQGPSNVGLQMRVNKVLISINATSEQAAKRFAKHMDDELKTKKQ
jgi:hypothetical protein